MLTRRQRETLLYVRTDPPGAKVFLDGKELGVSNGLFHVEPGSGTIHLEVDGQSVGQRPVVIRATGVTRMVFKLKPPAGAGPKSTALGKGTSPQKVNFVVGLKAFADGDNVVIHGVWSTLGTLAVGDTVTVKGVCTLSSRVNAQMEWSITAADADGPQDRSTVDRQITAGSVPFELTRPVTCPGHMHLSVYDNQTRGCIGSIYFGTPQQMQEIAHWSSDPVKYMGVGNGRR
jgi:hypothetical protein